MKYAAGSGGRRNASSGARCVLSELYRGSAPFDLKTAFRQEPADRTEPVEKTPVVADQQQRALRCGQRRLETLHRRQVEVVGRLIHDQQLDVVIHSESEVQFPQFPGAQPFRGQHPFGGRPEVVDDPHDRPALPDR